jgi:hypothetical protein
LRAEIDRHRAGWGLALFGANPSWSLPMSRKPARPAGIQAMNASLYQQVRRAVRALARTRAAHA